MSCNVLNETLGSISGQNFYICMQNVENVRAGFLIHTLKLKLWHFEVFPCLYVEAMRL